MVDFLIPVFQVRELDNNGGLSDPCFPGEGTGPPEW